MTATTPPLDRVLMTTDPIGGVWNFSLELCRGLGAHGVEVILASMGGPVRPDQRADIVALGNVELLESSLKLEWMNDPWHDVSKASIWLQWLEAQFAPDLVHLNGYAHGSLPWTAPVVITAHSDVLSWWEAVRGSPAPDTWSDYAGSVRTGLLAADLVAAPSRAMLGALERHYGALPVTQVIPNGRDPRGYFRGDKEPYILSVGRLWDEAKNARMLASVAREITWPVRVAGDATAPDGAHVELTNVEVLGRCSADRLAGLYSRAAIYVLPARYEPFGLSALEAGLSGCALVLGDIASLREIWGDAAVFVDPNDPRALRGTLQTLIDHPERLADLGARAQQRAREFTTERMVAEYLSTYTRSVATTHRTDPAGRSFV